MDNIRVTTITTIIITSRNPYLYHLTFHIALYPFFFISQGCKEEYISITSITCNLRMMWRIFEMKRVDSFRRNMHHIQQVGVQTGILYILFKSLTLLSFPPSRSFLFEFIFGIFAKSSYINGLKE